jgi:hypothetical protein
MSHTEAVYFGLKTRDIPREAYMTEWQIEREDERKYILGLIRGGHWRQALHCIRLECFELFANRPADGTWQSDPAKKAREQAAHEAWLATLRTLLELRGIAHEGLAAGRAALEESP